jgi:hypothetical protein
MPANPLDDEISFELGDCADDDDYGPPQLAASIQVLPAADELDIEMVAVAEYLEEVSDRSCDPIRSLDLQHLEATVARIPQELIETRSASFGARDSIGVLSGDLKTPLLGHRAKVVKLSLRALIDTRYA